MTRFPTHPLKSIFGQILALGAILGLSGCKTTETPNWLHPGSEQTQQARTLRYDPYPEPGIGTNVDGTRPRDFDKPTPEPERARWHLGQWE
jgi:hypothetical protein